MAFVYSKVLSLEGTAKVGTKQCVALVQNYLPAVGHTSLWKEGDVVLGNKDIVAGTVIATFVNGRYPSAPHGNHAAFFLRHAINGFYIMDQWSNDTDKPLVSERFIKAGGKKRFASGWWPGGGQNAYAYSIVER